MCEYQYVVCHLLFSRQDVLDQHIRAVHEKSFTEAGHRRRHENSKQHQLRLMNDGGDDDFFFYDNNRQRQLTISTSSSTTSTTTTAAKRLQCRQCTKSYFTASHLRRHVEAVHFEIRHRCPNCKSTFSSKSNRLDICVRTVSTKAISVRSMSKGAFRSAIGWPSTRFGHIEVDFCIATSSGSICIPIRASTAAITLRRGRCSHSHCR
jgi:hypothetical protein